ncbi:hypothetical protein [Magnetospirillum sp. 15-1]|uniref:hypothetical protein n=1 Tax=Magnetospirillum sp. 15-1 TaxID=1979370 RepID=UPI00114408D9|nr:hypothetical protein [Magnetospirillum sp. 15-1]
MSRLMSSLPVRKLAALLSLLMILLGGPAGGAFALCLGGDGHLAIEAAQARHHDHGSTEGISAKHHLNAAVDCIDIPLVQSAPPIIKKQTIPASDVALPVSPAPWVLSPKEPPTIVAAFPTEGPSLDPRLVSHRSVVLLN